MRIRHQPLFCLSLLVLGWHSPPSLLCGADGLPPPPLASVSAQSALDSADGCLMAGDYRPAAVAFARLQVQWGASDALFTRRFVSQVGCDAWDQAAVILASAQLAGYRIAPEALPTGSLDSCLAGGSAEVHRLTERLAAHALAAPDQREAMLVMAAWSALSGDEPRAALFADMASQLSLELVPSGPPTELLPAEPLPPVPIPLEPVPAEELPQPRPIPSADRR